MALNREVSTQQHLDAFLAEHPRLVPILVGEAYFEIKGSTHVEARESAHVVAWGSAHVEARESAHVEARESAHVVAWGSAHVEAWGSAHVEAWGSAHVVARESAHVVARESAHVVATRFVAIHKHSQTVTLTGGGVVIDVLKPTSPQEWCDFYGVPVSDGVAIVYKAVRADYRSAHRLLYEPGTTVEAPDWDRGARECGGGLHFSPHPAMALEFDREATRFLACPVALEDVRPPTPDDEYPHKIKARRCGPVYEVDRLGHRVATTDATIGRVGGGP